MRTVAFAAAFLAVTLVANTSLAQRRAAGAARRPPTPPAAAPAEPTPPPPPPAPRPSLLVAASVDGATVAVDGVDVGTTPLAPIALTPGSHTVTLRSGGYEPFTRTVNAAETGNVRVDAELTPTAATAERLRESRPSDEVFDSGATAAASTSEGKQWYEHWYVWAGAGAVVATAVIIGVVAATSGGDALPPNGATPIPPIGQ